MKKSTGSEVHGLLGRHPNRYSAAVFDLRFSTLQGNSIGAIDAYSVTGKRISPILPSVSEASATGPSRDEDSSRALKVGIKLKPGQRFGFHNFRHSLVTSLVSRGKDVKTIQELLRHAKVSTTLDLYSQSIDAAKLEAQEDIALAIRSAAAAD